MQVLMVPIACTIYVEIYTNYVLEDTHQTGIICLDTGGPPRSEPNVRLKPSQRQSRICGFSLAHADCILSITVCMSTGVPITMAVLKLRCFVTNQTHRITLTFSDKHVARFFYSNADW